MTKDFQAHLNYATRIVRAWPKWKQQARPPLHSIAKLTGKSVPVNNSEQREK